MQPDLSKAEMPGPGLLRGFRAGREPSVPKPTSTSSRYSLRFKDADFSSSIPRYQRQEGGERGVCCAHLSRCNLGSLPAVSCPQSRVPSISSAIRELETGGLLAP